MNTVKHNRIGRKLAYIIAKYGQMYLSPNCCFSGERKPTAEELGKLLIQYGSFIMACPVCGKKYIVSRRGNETEFRKVEILEYVDTVPVLDHWDTAAACQTDFEQVGEVLKQENYRQRFVAGVMHGIQRIFPIAVRNPAILEGKNHA